MSNHIIWLISHLSSKHVTNISSYHWNLSIPSQYVTDVTENYYQLLVIIPFYVTFCYCKCAQQAECKCILIPHAILRWNCTPLEISIRLVIKGRICSYLFTRISRCQQNGKKIETSKQTYPYITNSVFCQATHECVAFLWEICIYTTISHVSWGSRGSTIWIYICSCP